MIIVKKIRPHSKKIYWITTKTFIMQSKQILWKTGLRFQKKTNNKMLWAYVEIVISLF